MTVRRMGYSETLASSKKRKKQSAKWYGVFQDFNGILRRIPLFEDRRAADAMARIIDRLNSLRSSNETLPAGLGARRR